MNSNEMKAFKDSEPRPDGRITLTAAVVGVFLSLYVVTLFNRNILTSIPLLPRMPIMIMSQWLILLAPFILMKRDHEKLSDFFVTEINLGVRS